MVLKSAIDKQGSTKARKSITLERELEKKVRMIQARLIEKTGRSWSLSSVLNILVAAGLVNAKKLDRSDLQRIIDQIEKKSISIDESLVSNFVKKAS